MIDIANIQETIIDGYNVDRRLRQLQIIELDLLKKLLQFCKKHELRMRPYQEIQAELRFKRSWWKDFCKEITRRLK